MKCVYCGNTKNFNKEHVVPQFMGSFSPVNATIKANDNLVCQDCNSKTFNRLENIFKEDTQEGIHGQMLNLTGCGSVRIRGENVKMDCLSSLNDKFFNEIFPFLKEQDGKLVVELKPQIKIKNYSGNTGYQIFLFDTLKAIKENSNKSKSKLQEFNKIKKRMKTAGKNNIAIFVGGNDDKDDNQLDEAVQLLKNYGVKYNEKQRKFAPVRKPENSQFEVAMNCTITDDICRFIAKVAFNYFIYCSIQDGKISNLYDNSFDKLKNFILGDGAINKKDILVEISNDPITWHEKQEGKRFIGHIMVFFEDNNYIFSKITFFGGKVYKVLLGGALSDFKANNFGCGHLFYPFDQSIHNLIQQPKENPTEEEIKTSFGLFKRI